MRRCGWARTTPGNRWVMWEEGSGFFGRGKGGDSYDRRLAKFEGGVFDGGNGEGVVKPVKGWSWSSSEGSASSAGCAALCDL